MKRAVLRSVAERDIERAFSYYMVEATIDVAIAFVDAFDVSLEHITDRPSSGSTRYGELFDNPSLRSWAMKRFPYVLFHVEHDDYLDVIRILHQHSDIPVHLRHDDDQGAN
jgi:toxin ParE1/3/4